MLAPSSWTSFPQNSENEISVLYSPPSVWYVVVLTEPSKIRMGVVWQSHQEPDFRDQGQRMQEGMESRGRSGPRDVALRKAAGEGRGPRSDAPGFADGERGEA